MASKLVYSEYGDPVKVVHKENEEIPNPKENEVLVKMLAAPVNPADVNTIEGKYPSKPPLPAVPGNEGVGKIIKVGPGVIELSEGDHIVPLTNNLGTWRTHLILSRDNILKVPKKLGLVEAATLTVNPCTAYRMLVVRMSFRFAVRGGVRSVNVVRARPDLAELKAFLVELGANQVLTEEEVRTTDIFKSGKLEKPNLALNCVGGKSALEIMRHLQHGGTMVTYGGMSREPVTVPTSALIFKDIHVRGFWMTRWSKENSDTVDRMEMFEELISLMTSNDLQGPKSQMVDFDNYKEALINTMTAKGMAGTKFILNFDKS
ncbi:hypothetical protein NQ318_007960 [Aromia moschata]|uniref:Enoyl-[acyl-carrier-protein] reductase, mitochondrial n=1 Tax=Aromia moschata TaxID=1265417 RepID=A0AAV8YC24_9CUCU|nr:hypothetical protein NQ318_007960 [Aromia moschata]